MTYATTAGRPNPLAAFGALGVPAGFGAILVIGLAVNGTIPIPKPNPTGVFVPVKPEVDPVPPPDVTPKTQETNPTQTPLDNPAPRPMPSPDVNLSGDAPITFGSGLNDDWGSEFGPLGSGFPDAPPAPLFDPVKASPRGSPGSWITTNDYRSSWIRRELTGTARFTLGIDARGRVNSCTITGSTGHDVLDKATCRLLQARARFDPARDSEGAAVGGSYSNIVNWKIPD